MIENPWVEHNKKVLSGKIEGRTMPTEDEFELLRSEKFVRNLIVFCRNFLKVKSRDNANLITNGFGIGGSWIKGIVDEFSDIDIVTCSDTSSLVSLDDDLDSKEFHVNNFPNSRKIIDTFLTVCSINPKQHKASLTSIVFILNSVPFGKEFQEIQKYIIERIDKMDNKKRTIIWDAISAQIYESDSGRLHWHGENMKYSRRVKQFTLDEFQKRVELRCEFANKFCEENNIHF